MAANDALTREGAGNWRTKDGRFLVRGAGAGHWYLVDEARFDAFGMALVTGPYATVNAAKAAIEEVRAAYPEGSAPPELPELPAEPEPEPAPPPPPEPPPPPPPAEPVITWADSVEGVDWAALKAALADGQFDNGRTPAEYERSHRASHAVVFVRADDVFIGNGRILSDGVCNGYLVDIWTAPAFRHRGIGSEIVRRLLATVPGQHVALFTDDAEAFYRQLGFAPEEVGMSTVVGTWLNR